MSEIMDEKKNVRGFMRKNKRAVSWLCIAIMVMGISSFFAGILNTSFYTVDILKQEIVTEKGTISAVVYKPKDAGADDPRPVIVATHGYNNTKDQDYPFAIELSRRGYVVIAYDMYSHGDSRDNGEITEEGWYFTFWPQAQYDVVKWAYEQPYTKKDSNGNAYIGVTGHSMGGFSSILAMYYDELNALECGYRMISAGIPMGADYYWTNPMGITQNQIEAAYGSRYVGVVGGHYDEFFFGEKMALGYKDFTATNVGKNFIGVSSGADINQGEFYSSESGDLVVEGNLLRKSETGKHVIYTPDEPHAYNMFSKETTADVTRFFEEAFKEAVSENQKFATLNPENQIWFWKEVFNLITIIGFFMLFAPLITLIVQIPGLHFAVSEKSEGQNMPISVWKSGLRCIITLVTIFIPSYLFVILINKKVNGLSTLRAIGIVLLVLGIAGVAGSCAVKKKEMRKGLRSGGVLFSILSVVMICWMRQPAKVLSLGKIFIEPITNNIAFWAMGSAIIVSLLLVISYYVIDNPSGKGKESVGLVFNVKTIGASLAAAIISVLIAQFIFWIATIISGGDLRFWVIVLRMFKADYIPVVLCYLPFFFIFFFVNTIAVNSGVKGKRFGSALAAIMNIAGLVGWLILQYGTLFISGNALMPEESLNSIIVLMLVPTMGFLGVLAKKLYDKTNNIWIPSFINGILATMITCSSLAAFFGNWV